MNEKFNILYNKYNNNKTHLMSCSGLADIIEKGENESIIKYLNDNLKKYKGIVDNVVLGCTHYPLAKNEITKILGNVTFFEGSTRVAEHIKTVLETDNLLNNCGLSNIIFQDSSKKKIKEDRFYNILKCNK